jgi:hypothetical protein
MWNKTKKLCQNSFRVNDINLGKKSADDVLQDLRKFIEVFDKLKPGPCEFFTFYIGIASASFILTAVESLSATGIPVDQVVIALVNLVVVNLSQFVGKTIFGIFGITYYSSLSDRLEETMNIDGITYQMKYGNNFWADALCSIMSHERIRGCRVFVELAQSQRRNKLVSRTSFYVLLSFSFQLGVCMVDIILLCRICTRLATFSTFKS